MQSGGANHASAMEGEGKKINFEMETSSQVTDVSGKPLLSGIIYVEPFITAFHLEAYFG